MTVRELHILELIAQGYAAALSRVGDRWSSPTPCTDWDVSGLIDHVVGGNRYTSRILAGDSSEAAISFAVASFSGGSATADDAVGSFREMAAAFDDVDLDDLREHVAGRLGVATILRLRMHDALVHLSDLQIALDLEVPLASQPIEWALQDLDDAASTTTRHFKLGGLDASITDDERRYLAAFGR